MKIDRLLGILVYLLNRDLVSARILAAKFEVSVRTIQRDIETLNLAGIPVTSTAGVRGGYGIVDGYKIDKQIINADDYLFIITALKGLCTAYENCSMERTLEKLLTLPQRQEVAPQIHLDFGVLREGAHTAAYLKLVEAAIHEARVVSFKYTDTQNVITYREVEPIAVTYKWYAWYLFGFCQLKQDYRLFRLSRIREMVLTDLAFSMKHEAAELLLAQQTERDNRIYIQIKMLAEPGIRIWIEEYFPNATIVTEPDGQLLVAFQVPENERGWLGILLSFGKQVKVVQPAGLRAKLFRLAQDILETYS